MENASGPGGMVGRRAHRSSDRGRARRSGESRPHPAKDAQAILILPEVASADSSGRSPRDPPKKPDSTGSRVDTGKRNDARGTTRRARTNSGLSGRNPRTQFKRISLAASFPGVV